jgi:hypothetical protein
VRQCAPGEYLVFSPSGQQYTVQTRSLWLPLCDCAAHAFRDAELCVHAVAVFVHERRPHALHAMRRWLAEQAVEMPGSWSAVGHRSLRSSLIATRGHPDGRSRPREQVSL